MKQQQLVAGGGGSGEYNDTTKDISKKSTNIGDSIPVDNSVAHYELPNLTQCNIFLIKFFFHYSLNALTFLHYSALRFHE